MSPVETNTLTFKLEKTFSRYTHVCTYAWMHVCMYFPPTLLRVNSVPRGYVISAALEQHLTDVTAFVPFPDCLPAAVRGLPALLQLLGPKPGDTLSPSFSHMPIPSASPVGSTFQIHPNTMRVPTLVHTAIVTPLSCALTACKAFSSPLPSPPTQPILHRAAGAVSLKRRSDHVTPPLKSLAWTPIHK